VSRILIVDDERSFRHYLTRHLAREGHEVRSASSGGEAIEIGGKFPPDVLILDWMLDGSCNLDVAEALRTIDPDLRIILITGFRSELARKEAPDGTIFRFIEKPFDLGEISDAVRGAMADRADTEARPRPGR
jgi:two-component system NtrC family response regulator/two-component system nitrogen regulation response regulator GlnG